MELNFRTAPRPHKYIVDLFPSRCSHLNVSAGDERGGWNFVHFFSLRWIELDFVGYFLKCFPIANVLLLNIMLIHQHVCSDQRIVVLRLFLLTAIDSRQNIESTNLYVLNTSFSTNTES